jgi:hypothetical protein
MREEKAAMPSFSGAGPDFHVMIGTCLLSHRGRLTHVMRMGKIINGGIARFRHQFLRDAHPVDVSSIRGRKYAVAGRIPSLLG